MSKPAIFMTGCLAVLLSVNASAVEQDELQEILSQVYPYAQVRLTDMKTGTVTENGRLMPFSLDGAQEVTAEDKEYVIVTVAFKEHERELYERLDKGERGVRPTYPYIVVICNREAPFHPKKLVVDEKAVYVRTTKPEIGDFVNDGTTQMKFRSESLHELYGPREAVKAQRLHLYSFPDLKSIASITTFQSSTTQDSGDIEVAREVTFVDDSGGGPRSLQLRDKLKDTTSLVRFTDGKYSVNEPAPGIPSSSRPLKRRSPRKRFVLKFIDEMGNPVSGAKVELSLIIPNYLKWDSDRETLSGQTDSDGEFSRTVRGNVSMTVLADGFYYEKRYWREENIPQQPIIMHLTRKHTPVPVFRKMVRGSFMKDDERHGIGLVFQYDRAFLSGREVEEKNIQTTDREKADLWIEAFKIGETIVVDSNEAAKERLHEKGIEGGTGNVVVYNRKQWRIRLTGQNGWEIAPGPGETTGHDDPAMRIAPEKGYEIQLEYSTLDCPQGFFLRQGNGARYGKLFGVTFDDRGGVGEIDRIMIAYFLVQAEDTGAPSLNPLGGEEFMEWMRVRLEPILEFENPDYREVLLLWTREDTGRFYSKEGGRVLDRGSQEYKEQQERLREAQKNKWREVKQSGNLEELLEQRRQERQPGVTYLR